MRLEPEGSSSESEALSLMKKSTSHNIGGRFGTYIPSTVRVCTVQWESSGKAVGITTTTEKQAKELDTSANNVKKSLSLCPHLYL
jgi:hypothetical protein